MLWEANSTRADSNQQPSARSSSSSSSSSSSASASASASLLSLSSSTSSASLFNWSSSAFPSNSYTLCSSTKDSRRYSNHSNHKYRHYKKYTNSSCSEHDDEDENETFYYADCSPKRLKNKKRHLNSTKALNNPPLDYKSDSSCSESSCNYTTNNIKSNVSSCSLSTVSTACTLPIGRTKGLKLKKSTEFQHPLHDKHSSPASLSSASLLDSDYLTPTAAVNPVISRRSLSWEFEQQSSSPQLVVICTHADTSHHLPHANHFHSSRHSHHKYRSHRYSLPHSHVVDTNNTEYSHLLPTNSSYNTMPSFSHYQESKRYARI